jgi:PAS domain S-box-containing protein
MATKILVIDDEEANVRVLSISLRSDGYHVVTACSGEQGLEVFERESPDIVLTDIKMPGMDGIEVLSKLKSKYPDSEVIIITGHGDIDNAIEALKYGASDFINKPIRQEALSIALKRAKEKLDIRQKLKQYTVNLENEIREATRELRRQSSFLSKLIKSSNDGIVATDDDYRIVIFNPGAERIFGYSQDELLHRKKAVEIFPEDVLQALESGNAGSSCQTEAAWKETRVMSKEKIMIPVRYSGTLLFEKNKVMGSVAFFQDIREIKRLERELLRSERLAAVGQTVAGVAHGVKNILHGFKGGSYLVDIGIEKNDTQKLKQGWEMIQKNVRLTSDLVMDLLSYSKEREPELEVCFPNDITGEVCDLFLDTATEHGIQILREFDGSIGKVSMDPRSIHRALMNLMSNAIDACIFDEDSAKRHVVKISTANENGNMIRFEVADNGAGMSEEVKSKLFTSFFSTKGHKGTGLGLLVTRKLIEEHHGTIDVKSELGTGTIFTIRMPYRGIDHESRHTP